MSFICCDDDDDDDDDDEFENVRGTTSLKLQQRSKRAREREKEPATAQPPKNLSFSTFEHAPTFFFYVCLKTSNNNHLTSNTHNTPQSIQIHNN